jgi:hypothetical protein
VAVKSAAYPQSFPSPTLILAASEDLDGISMEAPWCVQQERRPAHPISKQSLSLLTNISLLDYHVEDHMFLIVDFFVVFGCVF